MSKSARRDKQASDARERREKRMQSGGKSKYAKKRALAGRGKYSKGSPFYVSPSEERAALAVGASSVDENGRPVLPRAPMVERDERGVPHIVMPQATASGRDPIDVEFTNREQGSTP